MIPLGPPANTKPAEGFVFAAIVLVEVQEKIQALPLAHPVGAVEKLLLPATPVKIRSVLPLRISMTGAPATAAFVMVTIDVEHCRTEPPVGSPVPL